MSVNADLHLHSSFSADCGIPMEEMILAGIKKGLKTMCFTEHNDFGYPHEAFLVNPDAYLYELIRMREKYSDKIRILFGIELGLTPDTVRENAVLAKSYDFDFIIGSTHACEGADPASGLFFKDRVEEEAHHAYFAYNLENVRKFSNFDVYGHLDYMVRYGPTRDREYSYEKHRDIVDALLKLLIEKGKGIEINTAGLRNNLRDCHPCTDIIRRYRELGGEIITVGSDAHGPEVLGADFDKAAKILLDCGFRYYTVFEKRVPEFHKL